MTQLVYGTVRHRLLCDFVLGRLCRQPLEKLPRPIHAVLRMGIFQSLFCNQVTHPAMVHTSVNLAKRRGHAGLARLVNAVLRRAPQAVEQIALPGREKSLPEHLSVRHSMPMWMVETWMKFFGDEEAEVLCAALNMEARPALRVNMLKTSVDELRERLAKSGTPTGKRTAIPEELTVMEGGVPLRSKWFQQGHFMVQDPASMLAPHLLEPQPGEWILDLCAAPGGKTTHLAQLQDGVVHTVALDRNWHRLNAIVENQTRLGLSGIAVVHTDGIQAPFSATFDRVLVDAPCSGLGTFRRHPDLKWRVSPESIARMAKEQQALLRSAVGLCKNGGLIVYSVCTFSEQETRDVIQATLAECQVQFEDGPEMFEPWKIGPGQYQTLPSSGALDAFFLTRLRKAF